MRNCDYVIVQFLSSTNYIILDTYSRSDNFPSEDVSLGGTADYKNCQYSNNNGNYTLVCERSFQTGDKYDYQFTIVCYN